MRTRGDRADIRRTRVRRGRGRSASLPRLLVPALISTLSIGLVLAHWSSQTRAATAVATGNVAVEVTGDLTYEFRGCTPGSESTACDKFDSNVIGSAPLSSSFDGATFRITGWVYKGGDPSEPVGFYYTITGGSVDIGVKSGRNYDEATLPEGSGYWLNPACEGDPGPGGSVTCTPRNTNAISHIDFCIKVVTPPTCPPLMQSVVASNDGSIPFELQLTLLGPEPTGTDYCGIFDLTINRVIGGTAADPPLFQGPLCDLVTSPLLLEEQLDPGETAEYKLTLSFTQPTSDLNGTSGGFTVRFEASQWNGPGGWTDMVDLPLNISVGSAAVADVSSEALPAVDPARIVTQTVRAPLDSALPTVIDVFGHSDVTITSWAIDPAGAVLGFDFTVRGDPVYVEVQRGALRWVDERWEGENPHVWHDPYGVNSPYATPITSIEFALVPLPDEPASEPPAEDPPAEEPPAEEPPAETATLTGIVWLDEDGDGVRATAESGVAGVVVRLLAEGAAVAATTTEADGAYAFADLALGDYTIEIEAPAGHTFTSFAQGVDPNLDSDLRPIEPPTDPPKGRTAVTLVPGESSGVGDAGLLPPPTGGGG